MNTINDNLRRLERKGIVEILERASGKGTIVKVHTAGGMVSLRGGTKEQLVAELCQMLQNFPDKERV